MGEGKVSGGPGAGVGTAEGCGTVDVRRRGILGAGGMAAVVLGVLVVAMCGLPWLLGVDPEDLSDDLLAGPSRAHWLGTDANGRDVLARVCGGARVSLVVGVAGAAVSLVIGVSWGLVAGYLGGRWDGLMMRTVDVLYAMPSILFVIVLVSVVQEPMVGVLEALFGEGGGGLASVLFLVAGLGGVSWLTMARIVRARVVTLRGQAFMDAARVLGAGHGRLLFRHLLPNSAGVILVYLTLTIPAIVLGESFLSFLGLGIQPPRASLGSLLADGAGLINPVSTPWAPLLGPGGVLVGMLLALGVLGDALRDRWDPRRRG